jgi:GH15 family glucan-1,4-alpha-glucosidase
MALPIEDYALIGDCHTAALVGRDGSIDWLCVPRFDSDACFAALLGNDENGRWKISPASNSWKVSRRYLEDTLILETTFETPEGEVALIDFMPVRGVSPELVRIVRGRRGRVPMRMELAIRFGHGAAVPWVTAIDNGVRAVAGPDQLRLLTPVKTRGEGLRTLAEFTVGEGDRVPFVLTYAPSHLPVPPPADPYAALEKAREELSRWSSRCRYRGRYPSLVRRSLLTLKALTYAPTGGIVAAPTTSLPERPGGVRNWDYRFCWLRDATFTLYSLMSAGYETEAAAWREWLLRSAGGDPAKLQIMYGLHGERRLYEAELQWLSGYEGSRPVRVGNAASTQLQLDVYGELMDVMHFSRRMGLHNDARAGWTLQTMLMDFVESAWRRPDEGIWEVRGERRHFTHSKMMAWVAIDRAIKSMDQFHLEGPRERWASVRAEIHRSVCSEGYDAEAGAFVQSYGSKELDASLLRIPLVGFLPADDERVLGTVRAIERRLMRDGLVERYRNEAGVDGLPGKEGVFLPCSFWLADNYVLQGRREDARRLFERLASLANDVGLLAEEYDPAERRLLGNFPQAFSHVSLVNSALNLDAGQGPAAHRGQS